MANQSLNWDTLKDQYSGKLVDLLRGHLARGPFRITAHQLAIEANVHDALATGLLREMVAEGVLAVKAEFICPCERSEPLTAEQANEEACMHCGRAFEVDVPQKPVKRDVFVHEAPQTRDVRWLLALHGMNTTGAWQETFNWLVSRTYRRSVPVAIYKYGVVRPGAVLKFRQRALIRGLNARIRRLSGQTKETGFGGIPDVIAHSLGTWLLGHALMDDQTLCVGRVILAGCILRPDFDWALLLQRGQVQAVLCHVATGDSWARIAHYIIPDSGPSGRRGFNDRLSISHEVFEGRQHSDFFKEREMPDLFEHVWHPFLTAPPSQPLAIAKTLPAPEWKEAWWPFRATAFRILLLVLTGGIALIAFAALVLGLVSLWRLI